MKDLLYLKDDYLKEFIEKLFIGYRESFNDPKKILNKYEFWMGIFTLATTWWLFNVGVLSSLVMIIPLLIAVTRP